MLLVVVASNILVQFPINDWVTWGAFTFPFAFLVTDLCNRSFGPIFAKRVVYLGFFSAIFISLFLTEIRIAFASCAAFLLGQVVDIIVFNRLRKFRWWFAPLCSSAISSLLDSILFFSLAFLFTGLPWLTWALGDYFIKIIMAILLLAPYRYFISQITPMKFKTIE
tara:strand:- start:314 stop:811 length:498 start_codon:yes stop_codon:yes gene_type:complete